jgi:glyoxylase-like metal-dependent hydrolase (beta-lactamase superfamily II)
LSSFYREKLKVYFAYLLVVKIFNVGYRSVNCYLLVTGRAKLLVDVGWPGGMRELKWSLAGQGFSVKDVNYVLVTHYHMWIMAPLLKKSRTKARNSS